MTCLLSLWNWEGLSFAAGREASRVAARTPRVSSPRQPDASYRCERAQRSSNATSSGRASLASAHSAPHVARISSSFTAASGAAPHYTSIYGPTHTLPHTHTHMGDIVRSCRRRCGDGVVSSARFIVYRCLSGGTAMVSASKRLQRTVSVTWWRMGRDIGCRASNRKTGAAEQAISASLLRAIVSLQAAL